MHDVRMSAACPVFGFEVQLETHQLDGDARVALWHRLEREVIAPRGLSAASLFAGAAVAFAVRGEASQSTDADRAAIEQWARQQPEIATVHVGPLVDLSIVA